MPKGPRALAQNRRARHDYDVLETLECGLALVGSEVKSIRAGKAQLRDAYARVDNGELWLHGVHVAPYAFATGFGGHDPERPRKLLAHRRQIAELAERVQRDGLALVPLMIYLNDGRVKVELALARGRKTYDKRHAIAERDAARDVERFSAAGRRDRGSVR
ncbi:MAG: SsrA-binding protein SmpB [Acidimicrobiales bacterium]